MGYFGKLKNEISQRGGQVLWQYLRDVIHEWYFARPDRSARKKILGFLRSILRNINKWRHACRGGGMQFRATRSKYVSKKPFLCDWSGGRWSGNINECSIIRNSLAIKIILISKNNRWQLFKTLVLLSG